MRELRDIQSMANKNGHKRIIITYDTSQKVQEKNTLRHFEDDEKKFFVTQNFVHKFRSRRKNISKSVFVAVMGVRESR